MNNALRPQTSAADGGDVIAEAIFHVGFREVASSAESAWGEAEVVKAFAICQVIGIKPQVRKEALIYIPNDVLLRESRFIM